MSMCPSSIESECKSLGLGLHNVHNATCTRTKIQWDWYMGMEVSSPGVSPMGLEAGTVPHTYEVYGIPVSACAVVYEGTFRYQLAKLSMN